MPSRRQRDRIADRYATDSGERPPVDLAGVAAVTAGSILTLTVLVSWLLARYSHGFTVDDGDWFWIWVCTWVGAWAVSGVCLAQPRIERVGLGIALGCAWTTPLLALGTFGILAHLMGG